MFSAHAIHASMFKPQSYGVKNMSSLLNPHMQQALGILKTNNSFMQKTHSNAELVD
jgi:hypothetical protein